MISLRGRCARGVPALLLAVCFPCVGEARAEIEKRVERGEVVYTSRPARKPTRESDARPRGRRPLEIAPYSLAALVTEISGRYGMDPDLVAAVIAVESAFNPLAVSPKGARGLMQLMPTTAKMYGVQNVHDPRENIEGGVAYLSDLREKYRGDMKLALAAYNAGPGAVERAVGVPNYQETIDYIRRIERRYGPLRTTLSGPGDATGWRRRSGGTITARTGEDGEIIYTNRRGGRRSNGGSR